MRKYLKLFLVIVIILLLLILTCSGINESPYEGTQLVDYYSSDTCLTRIRQYGDSAEVEIEVDGFYINITHKNALFNCCLDSIKPEFTQSEDTLKLTEVEYRIGGCYCTCPYEVSATIGVSEPGIYLIEIFAIEVHQEKKLVYQEWVEVL
jgi:hypothetical protein